MASEEYPWVTGLIINPNLEYCHSKIDIEGTICSIDFYGNQIKIDCGDGVYWEGTSQNFYEFWEEL